MSIRDDAEWREILSRVLAWSRERSYAGYSKHDALNSPLLSACSLNVPFLRLLLTQVVMRSPINVRPLLGVPQGRNPKGIGLFAYAYLDLAEATDAEEERAAHMAEAEKLLSWLVHHASPNAAATDAVKAMFPTADSSMGAASVDDRRTGLGWGYHYPWQDKGFFQPRHFPNRVVTSWIGFAFLRAYEVTGETRYLEVGGEIAAFLTDNPRILYEDATQLCLSYVPLDDIEWAVMDVSALVAAFLARYAGALQRTSGEHMSGAAGAQPGMAAVPERPGTAGIPAGDQADRLRAMARRLMAFVLDKQTDYGAWFYTWPAKDSHIKHDNYHTAIILDCLADYMTYANDHEWKDRYRLGLKYYREALFTSCGGPRWMNDRTYPHDIHGAASGMLAFTRAAEYEGEAGGEHLNWADTVLRWTVRHLYDPRGHFHYQKNRIMTKRFCLMRWCNAWMCRALARRLLVSHSPRKTP